MSILLGFLTSNFVAYSLYTILAVILAKYLKAHIEADRRKGKFLAELPGPPRLPLLGNALELAKHKEGHLRTLTVWFQAHGQRFVAKIGPSWRVFIGNAKDMEVILKSSSEITKSDEYGRLVAWLGYGLVTTTGDVWREQRKMLTPSFHFKILEEFIDVFNEQSNTLVEILKEKCCNNEFFDIHNYICSCALDIICESAMGKKIHAQTEKDSPYIHAITRLSYFAMYRGVRPWLFPQSLWRLSPSGREEVRMLKIAHEFTAKVIKERKEMMLETGNNNKPETTGKEKRRLAFLDTLLEAQKNPENNLTDEYIREQTDTFMFAGHDTAASSINFTVFLLAANPKVQEKLHQELEEIFQNDCRRPITAEDLSKMKYLECCLKESLRIYPSAAIFGRTLQNDLRFDDELTAPKGTVLIISPYFLHRDTKVFPDPEKFIPERFYPEETQNRHPFAYLPFSAGPRNCIGQKFALIEEKLVIANIFRHFTIEAAQKKEDLVITSEMVTRSESGIWVKLTPRS